MVQVDVWLQEEYLAQVVKCEVASHLLRNYSPEMRERGLCLAHVQNIEALVQVAQEGAEQFVAIWQLEMIDKCRDVLWLLAWSRLLVHGGILHIVRWREVVLFLEVNFELSLVVLSHDLVILNGLLFMHWLVVFLNVLVLVGFLEVGAIMLCTHEHVLFLYHLLLILVDLLLKQFDLLSQVFLLHLH